MDEGASARLRESIRHLEQKMGVLEGDRFACCGIASLAQCHALVEIGRSGRLSLAELAALLNLDTSTMSRTVEKLVKGKLAKREPDENDRRYVRIGLTTRGRELYNIIEDEMKKYYDKVLSDIPEGKREQVLESLELLLEAVGIKDCCSGLRGNKG